ncbi:four-carbon acid sugar kinase family protein [Paracoccus sp. Z330]|uniref:3-oxo-tetronate kinase n=1 Tax=Paracoccus onchidii TaxID=3017813 RepID=A0ABT4ZFU7_9RHOB|nr:3-oxo-tetronate kinase [Paracoccus onchidii]MDB6178205.1 four-carbon acid sugar kinase family protein [Paracoccus onchidii]
MTLLIGGIADDFTGATDLASLMQRAGLRVAQLNGVPDGDGGIDLSTVDAVVIALKTRTIAPSKAVAQSLAAADWLDARGAEQVFFKYCSTFDSRPEGNIGPVSDALRVRLKTDFALICPAFPENGRTVYQGHLFVFDLLLSDSPMKDHPLTPMRQSSVVTLMQQQSAGRVGLVDLATVRAGAGAIAARIETLKAAGISYGVVDATAADDLVSIAHAARGHRLVTGGSALGMSLGALWGRAAGSDDPLKLLAPGRGIVLAGSCSAATRGQIAEVAKDWPILKLDTERAAAGEDILPETLDWIAAHPAGPLLIQASADPAEVTALQARFGAEVAGSAIETLMGRLAQSLPSMGINRIVVAGGETSGAVVTALGLTALRIGASIAPGVPWTTAPDASLALALKSGNFGQPDFFRRALATLP